MEPLKAAFSIKDYLFEKVFISNSKDQKKGISIDFKPRGVFYLETKTYELILDFKAFQKDIGIENPHIDITFVANFEFNNVNNVNEIPDYFYKNSIALLFPYIRAFVSTLTLQANSRVLILPTMNLSKLENPLRENTIEI